MPICSVFAALLLFSIPLNSQAQNYEAMIQQQLQAGQQMQQQMLQQQQNIIQQNMNNPEVQRMYQQHLQSGGTMSFQDFAYGYAATGGYTAEGKARFQNNEMANQQKEQQAYRGLREAERNSADALNQMNQRNSDIAHYRGNLLNGTTDYHDPATGQRYNLPSTGPGNSFYEDQNSGENFRNDSQGNYEHEDDDRSWRELEEDQ